MSRHAYTPETDLWRGVPEDEKQRLLNESRGPLALAVVFSFYGASVLVVALRMYTRIWITNRTGLDDWLMVISMVGSAYTFSVDKGFTDTKYRAS